MGIYNFQPRFVDCILDGTKTHTIRAERKHGDVHGKWMHLYTGLRHKGARLLFRAPCVRVDFIRIDPPSGSEVTQHYGLCRVRIGASVGFHDAPAIYGEGQLHGGFVELDAAEKNALAWRDGFRDNGKAGAFDLMMQFWEGRLPFEGQIYHWDFNRRILPQESGIKSSTTTKRARSTPKKDDPV